MNRGARGDSLLMLSLQRLSNRKPPLLSESESGGSMSQNAPIVLLDEATASLDVENETKVQGALSRLLSGKTVLVIAHRMRTVEAADKIVVLSDGKVVEEGSPTELFAKENSLFRRMTQLQNASAGWSI